MPVDRELRAVLDVLLQDQQLEPVDAASLPWGRPVFVLRTAPMDRLDAFVADLLARQPAPDLHIMSHARDFEALRGRLPCPFTFHAYHAEGRYRVEEIAPALLERLRQVDFGVLVYVDMDASAALFDEAERILNAIGEQRMVAWRRDGSFARVADWRRRRLAQSAFYALVDWTQARLDPASTMSANQEPRPSPLRVRNDRS